MNTTKKYGTTLFFTGIALMGLASCNHKENTPTGNPVKVKVETVTSAKIVNGHEYVGVIEEEESAALAFMLAGTVTGINMQEGQAVSKGQTIATLDMQSAEATKQAAAATLRQAQDAYNRLKQLHDAGSLPDIKLVEVESKLTQAKSSYELARKNVEDCTLRTPFTGIIGKKLTTVGATVVPGQPVATLLKTERVKVKISVPEREIANIRTNDASSITVAALGRKNFTGGHIEKGIVGNALTHTYDVRITLSNNSGELLPGMVCNVTLSSNNAVENITVPITAVRRIAGEHFVWKCTGDRAALQPVRIGSTIGNRIEITDGLKPGEQVIIEGYQKVGEGTKITINENK